MNDGPGGCGCGSAPTSASTPEDPCLLPTAARDARLGMLRHELLPGAVHREEFADGVAWDFPSSPGMRRELEELVAFERACCPGLTWELEDAPSERVRLRVGGLDPGSALLAAAEKAPAHTAPRLPAWLRPGGIGLGLSLLLFCVAPLALATYGGAAVASRVSGLDDPLVIGVGAIAFGAVAWWLEHRRRRGRVAC